MLTLPTVAQATAATAAASALSNAQQRQLAQRAQPGTPPCFSPHQQHSVHSTPRPQGQREGAMGDTEARAEAEALELREHLAALQLVAADDEGAGRDVQGAQGT